MHNNQDVEKQISQWQKEGLINSEQARKMLADIHKQNKEQTGNSLVTVIATVGSIFLGLGVLLFVGANWELIPDLFKTIMLFVITFGFYGTGYYLQYEKKNFPRVGQALLFLGAILFGVTIFLLAQIYNLNANSSSLLFIWLVGVLPMVYWLKSSSIANLCVMIFLSWLMFWLVDTNVNGWSIDNVPIDSITYPFLFLFVGSFLYALGSLHYLVQSLGQIGRDLRLWGVFLAVINLFGLTFSFVNQGMLSGSISRYPTSGFSVNFSIFLVILLVSTILGVTVNFWKNPSRSVTNLLENSILIWLLVMSGIYIVNVFSIRGIDYQTADSLALFWTLTFNIILAIFILIMLFSGYHRQDMTLVNSSIFFLSIFLIIRYFDFFWTLMDRSIFFIFGGVFLLIIGIIAEKQRQKIKSEFIIPNPLNTAP